MSLPEKDRSILRNLAALLAEIAEQPIQRERAELWRRLNRLERVRPLVLLYNDAWHELPDEIQLETEDEFAREQELGLRRGLYRAEHMPDDNVYDAVVHSPIMTKESRIGLDADATSPDHIFGAKHFNTVIGDGDSPDIIQMPTVELDEEATEREYQRRCEIYDGILTVEKTGSRGFWFAIIDDFIRWRGIEQTFTDMMDSPQWVHSWLDRLTQWHLSRLEQCEKLGVLGLNNNNCGIGPGGLGFTDELPQPDFDGTHVHLRDQWGHATTQIFSEVSPAMHEEFALTYERPFLARYGLASYGCCEPLDRKMHLMRTIPNLRRVSMSPWVDMARAAGEMGRDYVFSYKPRPAIIGMEPWDVNTARAELRDHLDKTRGCVVEIIMKDLHTCHRQPYRMWEWVQMAMELVQEYA